MDNYGEYNVKCIRKEVYFILNFMQNISHTILLTRQRGKSPLNTMAIIHMQNVLKVILRERCNYGSRWYSLFGNPILFRDLVLEIVFIFNVIFIFEVVLIFLFSCFFLIFCCSLEVSIFSYRGPTYHSIMNMASEVT